MQKMSEVTFHEYLDFYNKIKDEQKTDKPKIKIDIMDVEFTGFKRPQVYHPADFKLEQFNVWKFGHRGSWCTHANNFRGNFSPHLVRNLLLKYTKENDLVLDVMVGSGTSMIECKLLNRRGIGVDINRTFLYLCHDRLYFSLPDGQREPEIKLYQGDARNLDLVDDESVDFIFLHPPYANLIRYSKDIDEDISRINNVELFLHEMKKVAQECKRVLKSGHYLALVIGDIRREWYYVPLAFECMQIFRDEGFKLKENIIILMDFARKRYRWYGRKERDWYITYHEHCFVLHKA